MPICLSADEITERVQNRRQAIFEATIRSLHDVEQLRGLDQKARQAEMQERRRIPAALRDEVLSDRRCVYCGGIATCVDHVIPIIRGGTSDRANLAPACRECNLNKLDYTPEEWRRWRLEEGLSWPPESFGTFIERHLRRPFNSGSRGPVNPRSVLEYVTDPRRDLGNHRSVAARCSGHSADPGD